jgi:RNA polymerase sigma-70 factor (ECF subfamily)
MSAPPTTRYSLLLRIADPQNHAAWLEFVAIYEPLVYRVARRRGLQDADARDLCQEVFRAVAGVAHRWEPDPARGSFRGWLSRVARNLTLNALRTQRRRGQASGDSDLARLIDLQPADDERSREIDNEYRRRLFELAAEAIEPQFTRTTWQAFWQTAVLSREVSRVAAELGISPGAVYIAKSRVLARLRERVSQLAGEEEASW